MNLKNTGNMVKKIKNYIQNTTLNDEDSQNLQLDEIINRETDNITVYIIAKNPFLISH